VLERLGQRLLAERQLSDGPNLGVLQNKSVHWKTGVLTPTRSLDQEGGQVEKQKAESRRTRGRGGACMAYRLQVLLELGVKGTGLEGDDLGSGIRVVGDGRSALGAEETVDGLAGRSHAAPLLDGAVDGELVFRDDGDESCERG
jgi:hypothetical protein